MIQTALAKLSKTMDVKIHVGHKRVEVFGPVMTEECIQALDAIGFEAVHETWPKKMAKDDDAECKVDEEGQQLFMGAAEKSFILEVRGMSCASCASKIERALQELEGALGATVSLTLSRAGALATWTST